MKKALKILGVLLGVIVLVAATGASYIHFSGIPTYDKPKIPEITVKITPERIAKGQKVASMLCVQCHSNDNNSLVGKELIDIVPAFGKIYSMNITMDNEKGIGNWTDGELIYFLRTGVRKNGSYAPPYMPKFPLISDEDMNSIVAWLRTESHSTKASSEEAPESKPSFLVKFLSHVAFKPLPYPEKPIEQPDTNDQIAWGKYLANGQYACYDCHSANFKTNNNLEPEKSEGFYGGGNPLIDMDRNEIRARNISPDGETGIGNWTEEDFITAMQTGKRKNGKQFRYPMMPYTRLTNGELKAIYAYLKTVPKIKNKLE